MGKRKKADSPPQAESYKHPDAKALMRPDVGTQAQFRKKKPPHQYRYDSSLSPALCWDGQNAARELGEALIANLEAELAALRCALADARVASDPAKREPALQKALLDEGFAAELARRVSALEESLRSLKALSKPFLDWAGKAERLSFDVPTLPLFVHERLSTQAILETLRGHRRSQETQLSLFGDAQHSIADQVLRAYEHQDQWVNRLILGDSLVVMNSLLRYESLGGQVQMIYMDTPYGVKFGSNFQPFVRKRDVKHGDDDDMTREPEMVQAYRDTWEVGLHSYLTYLRDRLLVSRELLTPSGSIFVQISDDNLHHVREVMDEVFGAENFVCVISAQKTGGLSQSLLPVTCDFILWYAKSKDLLKFRPCYLPKASGADSNYQYVELPNGDRRRRTRDEREFAAELPAGARVFQPTSLESANPTFEFSYRGKTYRQRWKTNANGLESLAHANRLLESTSTLRYMRYVDDFPVVPLSNVWTDTGAGSFLESQLYVVQTVTKILSRCISMTTDPGDLILDPTCGSGTTAYVAEQWGRRWISIDTSRVPLALARQRLLTATFPWYALKDADRGPAGGFIYKRKQNRKGEEVGGIVPHVTLKSIANNEPPQEEVLVDRPEVDESVTRISGPFWVEGTIPTAMDLDDAPASGGRKPSLLHTSRQEH